MSSILNSAIHNVQQASAAWCRYITGNDVGTTGSHQAGFYVPKCASQLLFEQPGRKGEILKKYVKIKWQDDFTTESCMTYYGQGTRNEYRITRFGRRFPFFQDENVGDLLVIAKFSEDYYCGYVLSSDEDIDDFLASFNLSPNETNHLIDLTPLPQPDDIITNYIQNFIDQFSTFPDTVQMANGARECYNYAFKINKDALHNRPDEILIHWIDVEYQLFRCMEEKIYSKLLSKPFGNLEVFIQKANEVLNRRKSRAGKSLEHHLADIFSNNDLHFEEQAITEGNKKPDFLFPSSSSYHDLCFPTEDLIVLGVKTTCKDRWRQVLSEANRAEVKYLFTLQQGISKAQLQEMHDAHLKLVVPNQYIPSFPREYQPELLNLYRFIRIVAEKQTHRSQVVTTR